MDDSITDLLQFVLQSQLSDPESEKKSFYNLTVVKIILTILVCKT